MPGLEVGDTVELRTLRVIDSLPLADLYGYSFFGAGRDSVAASLLRVDWPSDRDLFYVSEGFDPPRVTKAGDRTTLVWHGGCSAPLQGVPLSRPIWERAPRVVLSSHRPAAVSRELWSALDPFCGCGQQGWRADSLVESAGTDPGQLLRWLRNSIEYLGSDWGSDPGYSPKLPTQTLASRSGACRDMAVLLVWLLRAAGHDASLALCNTSHDLDDLVGSRSFNHMVVALREPDGGHRLMDPSLQGSADVPVSMRGRRYLVLSPPGSELERLPDPLGGDSMTISFSGSLALDGRTLQGGLTVRSTGAVDEIFAGILRRLGENGFLDFLQAYLSLEDGSPLLLLRPPGAAGGMVVEGTPSWSLRTVPNPQGGLDVLLPGLSDVSHLGNRNAVLMLSTCLGRSSLFLSAPINERLTLSICGLPDGFRPPESVSMGTFESRFSSVADTFVLHQRCAMTPVYPDSSRAALILRGLLARSSPGARILGLQ
jgi:hypothetical protein